MADYGFPERNLSPPLDDPPCRCARRHARSVLHDTIDYLLFEPDQKAVNDAVDRILDAGRWTWCADCRPDRG